jgi:uncharacterized membrane protein YagU involved in acid resistance
MATATPAVRAATPVASRVLAGAAGGLIGGAAFGAMMQAFGMLPMVAMLVGSESVAVGWGVHLAISLGLGAGFGLVAGRGLQTWASGIALGLGYGLVWWVLGALLIMPAQLGMPVLQLGTAAWQSLAGHLVFGLVLGVVTVAALRASQET